MQSLVCLKIIELSNFLAILELCAFYVEHEKVKFLATKFRGSTNVKCFMQTQLLRFCKDTAKDSFLPLLKVTTKSTFFPKRKKIRILWTEIQTNDTKGLK